MATSHSNSILPFQLEELSDELQKFVSSLPTESRCRPFALYQYQGILFPGKTVLGTFIAQKHFIARDSDLILATTPKAGTTWVKALCYAIVNRTRYPHHQSPLLTNNPHDLVFHLEIDIIPNDQSSDLDGLFNPRLFATHIPYSSLPESIQRSSCKVVYLCRNPRDTFTSLWHFMQKIKPEGEVLLSLEEVFDLFCSGISPYGPFLDHILGYWKASIEWPHKVMFLMYEDLKREPTVQLKILAEFLGYPFTPKEDREGVVDDIVRLCSFENLSNLEVNKTGKINFGIERNAFFRKGQVGDWSNYLTPQMIERLDRLVADKLASVGLTF